MIEVVVGSSGGAEDRAWAGDEYAALRAAYCLYLEQGSAPGYRTVCFYVCGELVGTLDGVRLHEACTVAGLV